MGRIWRVVPVVLAVAAALATAAPDARGLPPVGTSGCREASWAGGTSEWCNGTFVYRDYVYDDTGADTEPGSLHGTSLNRATGDVDHREHGQSLNSADIVSIRLREADGQLHVRFELNTLFPTDETVAVLALDIDQNDTTGTSGVLEGFGVKAPGIEQLYVFDKRDADPDDPTIGGVIEGTVPMPTRRGMWDVHAFTALGDGTVMNVAFRPVEEGGWWEALQSKALADGDIGRFSTKVSSSALWVGKHHAPAPLRRGLVERVYRSAYGIGPDQEGVDPDGIPGRNGSGSFAQYFHYLGRIQPYGAYIPEEGDDAFGIQLALHGYNAAHASLVSSPGMQQRLGDDVDRIIVVPLGRGPAGYYSDWSERDVLDVIADVRAAYPIDGDRIFSGGYSMGGYGALRMAALHPDLFAGVVNWVGFTGDCMNGTPADADDPCPTGAIGNVIRYLDNLRNIPSAHLYAAADELVHVHTGDAVRRRMAALGYRHVHWMHAAEHLTFAVLDDWAKEAAWTKDLRRVTNPARVTFRTNARLDSAALGIVHDRAYWVSGIRAATVGDDAVVDLQSHRCDPSQRRRLVASQGAGIDPVPWASQEYVDDGPHPFTEGGSITGTLTNVAALTVDVAGSCFSPGDPIDLSWIKTDVPTVVRFTDGRQPVTITP